MPDNFEKERARLKKAMDELVALNQIANAINALMSVEDITRVIVDHSLRKVNALQGAVFLIDEEDKEVDKFKTFIREHSSTSNGIPFHLNESLTGWMIKNRTILICNDVDTDPIFKGLNLSSLGIKSIISAPLMARNRLIGLLTLFNKIGSEGFTDDDKRFLGIVGSQTAKVIENAQLKEKEEKLNAIQEEMKIAQSIQKGFLPKTGVKLSTCEVCGINVPAREVGGDFYDIIALDENRVFISLGDVSGKGMPAALLMANAQAVLRSQLIGNDDINLTRVAGYLNQVICEFTEPEQFITVLFGIFNAQRGEFEYINAGHEPPIIIRANGDIDIVKSSDLIVGVVPGIEYNLHKIKLDGNELLFVCTDGILEAHNEYDEQFGHDRLYEFLKSCRGLESEVICRKAVDVVSEFRGKAAQSDDITSIILRQL